MGTVRCIKILAGQESSKAFTHKDVIQYCKLTSREIVYLSEKKTVVPDIADAHGYSSARQYSLRNLFEFAIAKILRQAGLEHAKIKIFIEALQKINQLLSKEIQNNETYRSIIDQLGVFEMKIFDAQYMGINIGQGTTDDIWHIALEQPYRLIRDYKEEYAASVLIVRIDKVFSSLQELI